MDSPAFSNSFSSTAFEHNNTPLSDIDQASKSAADVHQFTTPSTSPIASKASRKRPALDADDNDVEKPVIKRVKRNIAASGPDDDSLISTKPSRKRSLRDSGDEDEEPVAKKAKGESAATGTESYSPIEANPLRKTGAPDFGGEYDASSPVETSSTSTTVSLSPALEKQNVPYLTPPKSLENAGGLLPQLQHNSAGNLTIKLNFGIAQKNATLQASPTPKVAAPTESVQNFGTAQKNSTPITEIALKETEEKLAEETAEETDEETEEETEDDTDEETNEETNEETEEEIEDNTDEEIEDDTDEETDEDTDEDTEEDNEPLYLYSSICRKYNVSELHEPCRRSHRIFRGEGFSGFPPEFIISVMACERRQEEIYKAANSKSWTPRPPNSVQNKPQNNHINESLETTPRANRITRKLRKRGEDIGQFRTAAVRAMVGVRFERPTRTTNRMWQLKREVTGLSRTPPLGLGVDLLRGRVENVQEGGEWQGFKPSAHDVSESKFWDREQW